MDSNEKLEILPEVLTRHPLHKINVSILAKSNDMRISYNKAILIYQCIFILIKILKNKIIVTYVLHFEPFNLSNKSDIPKTTS